MQHPFVNAPELSASHTRQMLDQMRNPSAQPSRASDPDDDDDEVRIYRYIKYTVFMKTSLITFIVAALIVQ